MEEVTRVPAWASRAVDIMHNQITRCWIPRSLDGFFPSVFAAKTGKLVW